MPNRAGVSNGTHGLAGKSVVTIAGATDGIRPIRPDARMRSVGSAPPEAMRIAVRFRGYGRITDMDGGRCGSGAATGSWASA